MARGHPAKLTLPLTLGWQIACSKEKLKLEKISIFFLLIEIFCYGWNMETGRLYV